MEWEAPVDGEFEIIRDGLRLSVIPLEVHKSIVAKFAAQPAIASTTLDELIFARDLVEQWSHVARPDMGSDLRQAVRIISEFIAAAHPEREGEPK
jgi:hypothetical protein